LLSDILEIQRWNLLNYADFSCIMTIIYNETIFSSCASGFNFYL